MYIYNSECDTEKAIHDHEVVLEIASPLNLDGQLFWVHYFLLELFLDKGKFDDAQADIERDQRRIRPGSCDGAAAASQAIDACLKRQSPRLRMSPTLTHEKMIWEGVGSREFLH